MILLKLLINYLDNNLTTLRKHITVFEHQTIKLNQVIEGEKFDNAKLKAFQAYYGEKSVPYFSLIHNGIRFNEFVGVIQIGKTLIEVLPKADNSFVGSNEKPLWRNILIDMLFTVGVFNIHAPSSSSLKLKANSILDLYFELFINEVEYLLHNGLVKQYYKREENVTALKGSIKFSKHIQKNLTHQERFYVSHTIYSIEHKFHLILYKTLKLLKQINTNVSLHSRIGALILNFPEMPELKITETTFSKLFFNRKTQPYKNAIEISKLLLLKNHPDLSQGCDNVLALMFDMNKLWEKFVYTSLGKHKNTSDTITEQTSKYFWKPEKGNRSKIRPDIVLNKGNENCIVLDTKWKNLKGKNPSPDDLRQMFVYHEYYNAKKVALVYPGIKTFRTKGTYMPKSINDRINKECSVISLAVEPNIKEWEKNIYKEFEVWMQEEGIVN
jgi:5-methylcytosine-specific restriction enzyme subunit McrC